MGIPTILDKEFLFRKNRDIDDSEDFKECLAKYRKETGDDKEEQKKLDILQEEYNRQNKEDNGTTVSGGSSKGRNKYVESLKPEEDNARENVKNEQIKNEKVNELSDRQEQEKDDDYIK